MGVPTGKIRQRNYAGTGLPTLLVQGMTPALDFLLGGTKPLMILPIPLASGPLEMLAGERLQTQSMEVLAQLKLRLKCEPALLATIVMENLTR